MLDSPAVKKAKRVVMAKKAILAGAVEKVRALEARQRTEPAHKQAALQRKIGEAHADRVTAAQAHSLALRHLASARARGD